MNADKCKGMKPRMMQTSSGKDNAFGFGVFGFGVYRRSSAVAMVFDFALGDGI
jgi:hypothetical protein